MNETLCRALTQAALSEVDVAVRLEVDPRTVRRWMDGRLPYLRHRLVCRVAGTRSRDDLDTGQASRLLGAVRCQEPFRH